MDERLEFLIIRHNVLVRTAWMANSVSLTRRVGPFGQEWILTLDRGLPIEARLAGAAMMLQVIELGWTGTRFRFRFPLPVDDAEVRARSAGVARDYRLPYRLGLCVLVPDDFLARLEREQLDHRAAAARAGVTGEDFAARVRDWRVRMTVKAVPSLETLRASGSLRSAAETTVRPPSKRTASIRSIQAAWERGEAMRSEGT